MLQFYIGVVQSFDKILIESSNSFESEFYEL